MTTVNELIDILKTYDGSDKVAWQFYTQDHTNEDLEELHKYLGDTMDHYHWASTMSWT